MFVYLHLNVPLTRITDLVSNVSDEKIYRYGTVTFNCLYVFVFIKLVCVQSVIASVRRQLIRMPVHIYYIRIFFYWIGFDREAKRHFLTAFLLSLAFFVEACSCDGRTRAMSRW